MDQGELVAGAFMLCGYVVYCQPWRDGSHAHTQHDDIAG